MQMKSNFGKLWLVAMLALGAGACTGAAQRPADGPFAWSRERMDARWDPAVKADGTVKGGSLTHEIIARYKPAVDELMEPIGPAEKEISKSYPESPLSNFAADVILETARNWSGEPVDMALTNFGGLRTSLPAGEITLYDVLSVFPFDNSIVIIDLKGKDIREMVENFAKRNTVEAVSGLRVRIEKGKVKKLTIGGKPLEDGKTYRLATIDFLLAGGDRVYVLKRGTNVVETGIVLRDAMADYIRALTAAGKTLDPQKDGRVEVIK